MENQVASAIFVMLMMVGLIATTTTTITTTATEITPRAAAPISSSLEPNGVALCYAPCMVMCMIREHKFLHCSWDCLKHCIFPVSSSTTTPNASKDSDELQHSHYYCKLGCAALKCTSISTLQNPNEREVEGCVHSCDGFCSNNY